MSEYYNYYFCPCTYSKYQCPSYKINNLFYIVAHGYATYFIIDYFVPKSKFWNGLCTVTVTMFFLFKFPPISNLNVEGFPIYAKYFGIGVLFYSWYRKIKNKND